MSVVKTRAKSLLNLLSNIQYIYEYEESFNNWYI